MKNTRRNKKKLRITKFGMKFAKDLEKFPKLYNIALIFWINFLPNKYFKE